LDEVELAAGRAQERPRVKVVKVEAMLTQGRAQVGKDKADVA
jgi:hypothetical protein